MQITTVLSVLLAGGLAAVTPAFGEDSSSLSKLLNQIDTGSAWQQTPVGGVQTAAGNTYGMTQYASRPVMQQSMQPGFSPFSRQNLLRIFMGGDLADFTGNGSKSAAQKSKDRRIAGQTESLYERACNQAAQAESDEQTASKGSGYDQGTRQGAASSAQYHASDAIAAAESAESLTYTSTQYSQDYAAKTRDEANRAQAAADRAQYNASIN